MMQIVWRGQGGSGRECVRPNGKGGAYKPEACASDAEGVERALAADNADWTEEAAWATDMSSLVFVFRALWRGGEWREVLWTRELAWGVHVWVVEDSTPILSSSSALGCPSVTMMWLRKVIWSESKLWSDSKWCKTSRLVQKDRQQ